MPIAVAATLHMRTGRRPARSEMRPQTGTKRNCISEKLVPSRPTMNALAPYDSA